LIFSIWEPYPKIIIRIGNIESSKKTYNIIIFTGIKNKIQMKTKNSERIIRLKFFSLKIKITKIKRLKKIRRIKEKESKKK